MKAEGREVTQTLKWTLWTAVTDVGGVCVICMLGLPDTALKSLLSKSNKNIA